VNHNLDPGGLEIGTQLAVLGQNDDRPVPVRVKSSCDQVKLAVGSVAARRGVNVEDGSGDCVLPACEGALKDGR
jgi:hypothetical protein